MNKKALKYTIIFALVFIGLSFIPPLYVLTPVVVSMMALFFYTVYAIIDNEL
jgi:hypothetical protein|tara:strand:- start:737 stop:892 length:156 start_codon:yes stop_codon:yes gene_type:complete